MAKTNIGIVGLGWAARAHIDFLKRIPQTQVIAICSERSLDEEEVRRELSLPVTVYRDYSKMLQNPDIHLIDICTKPRLHAAQAILAANAGKHVIIEKPAVMTLEEAIAVSQAVGKAGVKAAVCFELRFSMQFKLLRSLIEQGLIGEVHYGECDYFHGIGPWYALYQWNWLKKEGGSSLLTAGCHALDALRMLVADPIVEVTAWSTQSKHSDFAKYEFPTTTAVLLKTQTEKVLKVTSCIDSLQPYMIHTHLLGSAGSIWDNKLYSEKFQGMKKEWATLPTILADSGDVKDLPYEAFFRAVIEAIQKDRPIPLVDLETALETHRIIFAADESVRTGRPVKLK